MQLRGLPGTGEIRLPYIPLEEPERAELAATLERCDATLSAIGIVGPERARSTQ
jgi:dihydrodipicolinate synthase/N-acetylneuraminate lyase